MWDIEVNIAGYRFTHKSLTWALPKPTGFDEQRQALSKQLHRLGERTFTRRLVGPHDSHAA